MNAAARRTAPRSSVAGWAEVARPARPVLRELLVAGPQTRTALARRLGLSTGSLTRLTKPLVQSGLLVERGVVHDTENGRPTRPLDVVSDDHHFCGIKLTADHMYAVVTDLRARVVAEGDEPLDGRSPEAVFPQARRLMDRLSGAAISPVAAGLTLGGSPRPADDPSTGEVFDAPFLGWRGVTPQPLLDRSMGIPCVIRNDVLALAHSHHWFGAARGLPDFALVTMGAGIGYALCVRGHMVLTGEEDLLEFSHHILDPGGPMCVEGHRGCLASYLSTQSVLAAAAHGLRRPVTLEEVADLAREGDAVCRNVARQAGWALGATIASIANLTSVKTVVVAGEGVEVARAAREYVTHGMGERRRGARHTPITVTLQPSSFTAWARGGAVDAIRTHVVGED